jgi:CRISPR-associated protein Csm3
MLKKLVNHAVVELNISPIDPMLIKSGQATVSGVDMSFVKTYKHGQEAEPFIPGSSMKGLVRSYAEKICRSLRAEPVPVCLPYLDFERANQNERAQASCGSRFERFQDKDNIPSSEVYRLSCPACRLFGSQRFLGRLATSDGYITEEFKKNAKPLLEVRDGVAIDRLTGGTAGNAKYDLEVLTKGEFGTQIEIQNFERWQLGLLGLVIRDMTEGLVRIGMGKSRGLGRIQTTVTGFRITYFGKPQENLVGMAPLVSEEEAGNYGFFRETGSVSALPDKTRQGLRYTYDLTSTWQAALDPAVADLVAYVDQVAWPQEIDTHMERRR